MMVKLPDEGGNTWFGGVLVTQFWIDRETNEAKMKLANGKWFYSASPLQKWTEIFPKEENNNV